MLDYIIVGLGLAGIAFCEELEKHNKSYVVINQHSGATAVSAGTYNAVILKRITLAWEASDQLPLLQEFYPLLERKFHTKLLYPLPFYRIFHSVAEQNQWFEASDKPWLQPYISDAVIKNSFSSLKAPYGFGEILQTGRVDLNTLLKVYTNYLSSKQALIEEEFNFDALEVRSEIVYKNYTAQKIVFAEGFGLRQNPFFNQLPLDGSKGELLLLHLPDWELEVVVKSDIFVVPLGNYRCIVGTTYDFDDKTSTPTQNAKTNLLNSLKKIYTGRIEIIDHWAGIRPTVRDRHPLVGRHPHFKNVAVLNGLGTRGVMLAPYVARMLFEHLENNLSLHPEASISRFKKIVW